MIRSRPRPAVFRASVLVLGVAFAVVASGPAADVGAAGPCAGTRGAARAKCLRRVKATTTTTTTTVKGPRSEPGAARGQAFPGTGSFAVGTEVRPGLYRSIGDPADPKAGTRYHPYYARLDAAGEIIDNGGPWWTDVVWTEILPTDARFETERFLPWEPVDPTRDRGPRATSFPAGETCVLVGYDVVPGTYRASVRENDPALATVFRRATFADDEMEDFGFVEDGDERVLTEGRFFCSEGVDEWARTG